MRSADMAFAEYLDWCCGRYAKSQSYRRTLDREKPTPPQHSDEAHDAHTPRRSA